MTMSKTFGRISNPYLAYLFLLMGFALLGVFVAALATGSDRAAVAGGALVVCAAASVAGFRAGARRLAESRAPGAPVNNVSIFSTPLRSDEIERYLQSYRSRNGGTTQTGRVLTALAGGQSTAPNALHASGPIEAHDGAAEPNRLSA
jgi:hypothetical protein